MISKRSVVLGAIVLVCASGNAPANAQPVRSIQQVTANLYRAQNDQHFAAFLVTSDGIVLCDPINREFATWLRAELQARFDLPVRYVLYSHHHWDHASGGDVFADTAEFVANEAFASLLALPTDVGNLPEALAGADRNGDGRLERSEAGDGLAAPFASYDEDGDGALTGPELARGPLVDVYPANRLFSGPLTLTLGGQSVEMIPVGPTHSDDMTVIRFPGEDAIFVVDFVTVRRLPFRDLPDYEIDDLVARLRSVEGMDYSIVVGGHGPVGSREDVADHRRYVEDLRAAVAAGIDAGLSLEQIQATVDLEQYSDWGNYDAWLGLNVAGMYRMLTRAE